MINLPKRLGHDRNVLTNGVLENSSPSSSPSKGSPISGSPRHRASIRDRLLAQELHSDLIQLPSRFTVRLPDTSQMHEIELTIQPADGLWSKGKFVFKIDVPYEYNNVPPKVRCLTKLWHPNINEDGAVCLSILRTSSLDGTGWLPTRRLRDIIWGLDALFGDLVDYDDPLNVQAAEQYRKNPKEFGYKVEEFIRKYCH